MSETNFQTAVVDFLTLAVKMMSSEPNEVRVSCVEEGDGAPLRFEIIVPPQDAGRIIGRRGKNLQSLRMLCRLLAPRGQYAPRFGLSLLEHIP